MISVLIILFIFGYILIIFEHSIKIDKAVTAILTGVLLWTIISLSEEFKNETISNDLLHILGDISAIFFFLLGAMTIVELIDLHQGFKLISKWVKSKNKMTLLLVICLLTFFLSAVLDNLTTTIVMISIVRKMIDDQEDQV